MMPSIERNKEDREESVWDNQRLKARICQLPQERKSFEQKMLVLNNRLELINQQKKEMEQKVFADVCNEKIGDKPKFTNQAQREAEQSIILKSSSEYAELLNNEFLAQKELKEWTIEANYARRETKAIELLVELLKID